MTPIPISCVVRYLAQMYMAEAQVSLDHIADAIQHLATDSVTDVSTAFPEPKQDSGEYTLHAAAPPPPHIFPTVTLSQMWVHDSPIVGG